MRVYACSVFFFVGFLITALPGNAAVLTWTGALSNDFNNPGNWSPAQIPGPADDVLINLDATYTVVLSADASVNSLQLGFASVTTNVQSMDLNGHNFGINALSNVNTAGRLVLSSGIFGGIGNLTISGALEWTGGTFGLQGMVSGTPSSVTLSGSSDKFLQNQCHLALSVDVAWTGTGDIVVHEGAIFEVPVGTIFDMQTNQDIRKGPNAPDPSMVINGSVHKTIGTLGNPAEIDVPIQVPGSMDIVQGSLILSGGGVISGGIDVAAGGELAFDASSFTQDLGSSIFVDGMVAFIGGDVILDGTFQVNGVMLIDGGVVDVTGDITPVTVELWSGTLMGDGNVTATSQFLWFGGSMEGAGETIVPGAPSMGMDLQSSDLKRLDQGRTLRNFGSINWIDGNLEMARGAFFDNSADMNVMGSVSVLHNTGLGLPTPGFQNNGFLTKVGGSGNSTIEVPFVQNQTLSIDTSTLIVDGSFDQTLSTATTTLVDGTLRSTLPLSILGGMLTGSGTFDGDLTLAGQLSVGGPSGVLHVTGDLVVDQFGSITADIRGTAPGTDFDQIQVNGTAVLDGFLNLTYSTNYSPIAGDFFKIMEYGSSSGTFASVSGTTAPGSVFLFTHYGPDALQFLTTTNLQWVNPAGGSWDDPTNWSPAIVPQSGFSAEIVLPGAYTVQLQSSVTVSSITLGDGSGGQVLETNGNDIGVSVPCTISNGSTLQLQDSIFSSGFRAPEGVIELDNHGTILAKGSSLIDIPIVSQSGSQIKVEGFGPSLPANLELTQPLVNHGTLTLTSVGGVSDAILAISGGLLTNSLTGQVHVESGSGGLRQINSDLDNFGSVFIRAPLELVSIGVPLKKETFAQPNGHNVLPTVFNAVNQGIFQFENGANFVLSGTDFLNDAGGLLIGEGGVDATSGIFGNSGEISPGMPYGAFQVVGDFEQTASGLISLEINGTNPGVDYDVLDVSGTAILDGMVNVVLGAGFSPQVGDTFEPFRWMAQSGTFNLQLPNLTAPLLWQELFAASGILLTVESAGTFAFNLPSMIVQESSGVANVVVERLGGSTGDVEVTVETIPGGTATPGDDFTPVSTVVQFLDGDSSPKTVAIPIVVDATPEPPETLFVGLSTASGGSVIGTPNQVIITIMDEQKVRFDQTALAVNEQDGSVTVSASLDQPASSEVTVALGVQGTAIQGSDFQISSSNLVFPEGAQSAAVTLTVLDDNLNENDETVRLSLASATNATIGLPDQFELTIQDDDILAVAWSSSSQTVTEDDVPKVGIQVTAHLTNISSEWVHVHYTVSGTALFGEDHNLEAGLLSFAPESNSATLTFDVLGDLVPEADEQISLRLRGPSSAIIESPNIHIVTIQDNDQELEPDTVILRPEPNQRALTGEPVLFSAQALPVSLSGVTFEWEIVKADGTLLQSYTGREVGPLSFHQPGNYVASCRAINSVGLADSTPATVVLQVRDRVPPEAAIIQPGYSPVQLNVGDGLTFIGEANQTDAPVVDQYFFFASDPETHFPGNQFSHTFEDVGNQILVFEAVDSFGQRGHDFVVIQVLDAGQYPSSVQILSPSNDAVFDVGESVLFQGQFNAKRKLKKTDLRWQFGDGSAGVGAQAVHQYTEPGRFRVRLLAREGEQQFVDTITIFVRSNNLPPVIDINITDNLELTPPGRVFLRAKVLKNRGHSDLQFHWNLGQDQTMNRPVPGWVSFTEEGTYQIHLVAVTPSGLRSQVASRTITVRQTRDSDFEPNEGFGEARTIQPGSFDNMELTEDSLSDFFKVNIERPDQTLRISVESEGPTRLNIFNSDQVLIQSRTVTGNGTVQVHGLVPGTYFLQFQSVESKLKTGLGYGFGVTVLDPSLFFPEIKEDFNEQTELGFVNPNLEETSLEVIGYNAFGEILKQVPLELPAKGRYHGPLTDLFGDEIAELAWVQVDSSSNLQGYSLVQSRDEEQMYALSAIKKQSSELFIPHIAERTAQWQTRASIANTTPSQANASLRVGEDVLDLNLGEAFALDRFDFLDVFDGQLPANAPWGIATETKSEMALVGAEVFGKIDGNKQVAGLGLVDNRQDNPNFTYIRNNIYFTHIARSIETFWTGISLVNISSQDQTYMVKAYGDGGTLIGEQPAVLGAGQKLVQTATDFLAGIGSPANIDWVLIEADAGIVGFELFGTHDNRQLAGFEASTFLTKQLTFPYYNQEGTGWHGVSVVNVSEAQAEVVFKVYDDFGRIVDTATRELAPMQKFVSTLADLFPGLDIESLPGWIDCESNHPIAGFELFGDKQGHKLGGILSQ